MSDEQSQHQGLLQAQKDERRAQQGADGANKRPKTSWKKDNSKKDYVRQSPFTKEQLNTMMEKALKRHLEKHGSPGLRPEPTEDSFAISNPNGECKKNFENLTLSDSDDSSTDSTDE